jgi:pentose-5-phosphate-3-epimerase
LGATVLVAGSYVFGGENYRDRIEAIRRAAS